MKRDAAGKFVQSWDAEAKQRVSISLTTTAWRSLDKEAQKRGISRSEVIEHFARSLDLEPSINFDCNTKSVQEAIAQATERKVTTILESITDAFVAFDRNWCYTYVNHAAAQILQQTPDQLIGKHVWTEVFPEKVGSIAYQALHRAIAEQVPVSWEEEVGQPVECWVAANAYPSAEGVAVYFQDVTERKQAEAERERLLDALETERAQFEAVLRQMPAGVLIADAASGSLMLANEQAKQILEYNYDQSVDLKFYTEVTPFSAFRPDGTMYAAEEYPLMRSLSAGETVTQEEMKIRRGDGSQIFITVNASAIRDRQAQITAAVVVFQDVTEHKHLASRLQQQEQQFRILVESIPDIVSRVDRQFRHLYISPSVEAVTGISPQQFIGKTNLELGMPKEPCELWHDALQQVFDTRAEQTLEFCFSTATGLRWYQSHFVPELDQGGSVVSVLGVARDVTDYKQAEQALRESEERLTLALEATHIVTWDMDLLNHRVVCSPNAQKVWGLQAGSTEEFFARVHPDDCQEVKQAAAQAVTGGETSYAKEYRVISPDGTARWLNSQGRIYLDSTGQGVRMIGISVDVTERKQMEAERDRLWQQEQTARQQAEALLEQLQQKERQQQFLIELTETVRALQDPKEIMWHVVRMTGQHLNVTRCTYGEIDSTQQYVMVDRDYCKGVVSAAGTYFLNDYGPATIAELKQGKTLVIHDVDRDARTVGLSKSFEALQAKSVLAVPLVKAGRFVAVFTLHHVVPRHWTQEEMTLMERIAEKTWLAVERSRAEEELRESEARLQLALQVGRMGTWDWNIQTGTLLWSEGHFLILGLQPYEVTPSYEIWSSRVHPEDLAEAEAKWQQAIQEHTDYHHEYRLRWENGSIHWVEARGQFFYDAQRQPQHSIGVVIDITERKQAEEALHHALQKLNFHFENTPLAVIEWNQDFRVTRWSASAERILGWKAEEVLGRSLAEIPFVFEEDLEPVMEVCQRLVYGQEPHIFAYNRNYTKNRDVVHCEWYNSSLRDESGQMTSILSLVLDVTERKQAEQEREQLLERERLARSAVEVAQQQLKTIFETSPIGIALLDDQQRYVAINEALAEINGLSREQHLGRSILDLFGESDPHLVAVFEEIYATGNAFISPSFAVSVPGRSDRRPGYYNVYYLPTVNATHQVERVLVYVVDVTERVKLEQAQQFLSEASAVLASSLDYQTTLEQVAQLTVPKLADWCTVHMVEENGTIEQIAVAHNDPAKLEWAQQLQTQYPLDTNAKRGAALTLRTGQSDFVPEIPDELLVQAAHSPEHLEILRQVGFSSVMTVPLRVQSRIMGVIAFISAESRRRYTLADLQLAEELARRASLAIDNAQLYQAAQRDRTKAETANRIKDEFLAVLSHELRSPLNPILGWTRMLRTQRLDATKAEQALETIERNARLQAQLIEDLLDISRILQGKMSLNIAPVNLAIAIQSALETVRLAAEAKQIHLHTTLHPISGSVSGDSNRLQQVIWNLLSNAVKFTPAGGRVEVRLEQIGTYAQIQVKDTGRGINPEFLPHVFDYFRQEDGTTTRKFGGLGLGLAIARQLTELHGGTVQAESLGQDLGATFSVRLPLNLTDLESTSAQQALTHTADLTGVRVLVVDDDADMRDLASFILTQAGAQVMTAASAIQAFTYLNQSIPDLLLCDVGMPEMDGYALIRQVRKWTPAQGGTIPAIALTAYAGEVNQQQALSAGFQQHLSKPVDPEELVQAIFLLIS